MSINVALYGAKPRWAMTERGQATLDYGPDYFSVGPSRLEWQGDTLVIDVDEITAPLPSRLRGQIRFTPEVGQPTRFALDSAKRHHWWPYAPFGEITAEFSSPKLTWTGHGYADTNTGTAALEADFSGWTWSRANTQDGAILFYEPDERAGPSQPLAFHVGHDGLITHRKAPPIIQLKTGFWGIKRTTRSEDAERTRITETMVDAPFYTRDALELVLDNQVCPAVHESLNLDRFKSPIVKTMLPVKMPRRAG